MRDYLVLGIILGSLPFCLYRPFWGVLIWTWISLMNPHRLGWGAALHFPVAQYVGIATLLGFLISKEKKTLPIERETILLLLLYVIFCFSTVFALVPSDARNHFILVTKMLLMTFVTMIVCRDRQRLRLLLIVASLSVGFYGVKGAIFSILSGGSFRVYGPPGTFFEDNNDLALALVIVIPLLFFLAKEENNFLLKRAMQISGLLSIIATIFTYSRGGLLGLIVIGIGFFLRSTKKIPLLIVAVVITTFAIPLIPQKWYERMETITDVEGYQQEGSIRGRFNAWQFAINLALDRPLFGGGFDTFTPSLFQVYAPDPDDFHDAHSIYFEILGEQGFSGLMLFLVLLGSTLLSLRKIRVVSARIEGLHWMDSYSRGLELSLLGYLTSGATLGRAYFDLMYLIIASAIILKHLLRTELVARLAQNRPRSKRNETLALSSISLSA